jgi:hypothetical protein
MSISFSDPTTGWSFDCVTDPSGTSPPSGGIVLKDVRHRSNNFASDLRLIGLRILVADIDPGNVVAAKTSWFVPLVPSLLAAGPIQELKPSALTAPPAPTATGATFLDRLKSAADELVMLKSYFKDATGNYTGYGIRADYVATPALFAHWPNCEMSALKLSQIFLFSVYGKSPPHEPGGVLMAARCHPLTTYAMAPNTSVDRTRRFQRIESIRFDYRLHLTIDSKPAGSSETSTFTFLNNAGLFRDNDAVSITGGIAGVFGGGRPLAFSKAAFAAVEKQLILEVVAPGLAQGLSGFRDQTGDHWCWDNVHWWGNRGTGPMISTPGAFHAAHIHWRWGSAGSSLRPTIPVIDTTGRPPGLPNRALGGVAGGSLLVDPRIWIQTIRVAVAHNDAVLDPNVASNTLDKLSTVDWKSLFTGLRPKPLDIAAGSDIVCWYSVEVHRELPVASSSEFTPPNYTVTPSKLYTNKLEGTVFLHGIFFAHEAEITGFGIGATGPLHWSRSEKSIRTAAQWFRDAN